MKIVVVDDEKPRHGMPRRVHDRREILVRAERALLLEHHIAAYKPVSGCRQCQATRAKFDLIRPQKCRAI